MLPRHPAAAEAPRPLLTNTRAIAISSLYGPAKAVSNKGLAFSAACLVRACDV